MNPIERRLNRLHDQWTAFVRDTRARLLRWVVASDELRMVEAFRQREADSRAAQTGDVLFKIEASFESSERHGWDLRQALLDASSASRKTDVEEANRLQASGTGPPSEAPRSSDGMSALLAAMKSFRATCANKEVVLGLWLAPKEVTDREQYLSWLRRLVQQAPADCRFVVLDAPAHPDFAPLAEVEPERIKSIVASLDMASAVREILQEADATTPGAMFRSLLVEMGSAAETQDLARAITLVDEAVALATEQKWFSLAAVPNIILGGGLSSAGRLEEAAQRYEAAEASAARAEAAADPQGAQLRLQARMMRGSALIAQGAFAPAAELFREAVLWAKEAKDARATLDCCRLASYGFEQSGQIQPAWNAGLEGFEVGRAMDDETRETSTLAYLSEGLMRLTEQPPLRDRGPEIERRIVDLLGDDWRPGSQSRPEPASQHSA